MKIGILTFHYSNNYGALLQAFALQTVLKNLGHSSIIINRFPSISTFSLRSMLSKHLHAIFRMYYAKSFKSFRKKYLLTTRYIRTNSEMQELVTALDCIIVGSDQVWRLDYSKGLGLNYFLDFVPSGIKKIAYAASFGNETFEANDKVIKIIRDLLKEFQAISVREDSGVTICKNVFGITATHVLDPTLLLPISFYLGLCSGKRRSKKFIAQYFLDPSSEKQEYVKMLANYEKLEIINITRAGEKEFSIRKFYRIFENRYPSFSNWLSNIMGAEFVVTDSYHGVVFSILFNKQFLCIANESRGISRMRSILNKFNLIDRLVFEGELLNIKPPSSIDYYQINKILDEERKKSYTYLYNAI